MDGRQYLPTVAWSFKVRNVIFLTAETIESPATFRCDAVPFDSSEPGANQNAKEIGFYVTDNVGNIYSIIGVGTNTVDLSDDFRCGVGPQTGKWAIVSKSVGNGDAPFLTPIHYRRLDRSAIDNIRRIELDILWKHRLFTYTAYASDAIGTGFSRTNVSLPYQATLESPVEIVTPVVDNFVGLWRQSNVTIADEKVKLINHGFTVGMAIKPSGSGWIKTKADTAANAGTVGFVIEVIDTDNFKYINSGLLPGEYTPNSVYFLSTATAGAIMTQTDPELWAVGNVREVVGTANADGTALIVQIEQGEEICELQFVDQIQSDWEETDPTKKSFIKRKPEIPSGGGGINDLNFDYGDIASGIVQTKVLDPKASVAYTIPSAIFETDSGTIVITIKINGVSVTGLANITVTNTCTEFTATALNTVAVGDRVTLETTTGYTGSPFQIIGGLRRQL